MFNGDPEGELPGDNGEGDRENGEGDRIVGKGQRPVLKGEPLGEEEPDLFVSMFVSSISIFRSAFPTNTKNKESLPLNKLCRNERKNRGTECFET